MSDRRKLVRKATSDYFLIYDNETDKLLGRVMDMNTEGVMLISESPVSVPGAFQCKMTLPRMIGRYRYLYFEAECKWCRKNARLGWFEAGYQFGNLSDENWAIIEQLVEEWVTKPDPSQPISINRDS